MYDIHLSFQCEFEMRTCFFRHGRRSFYCLKNSNNTLKYNNTISLKKYFLLSFFKCNNLMGTRNNGGERDIHQLKQKRIQTILVVKLCKGVATV